MKKRLLTLTFALLAALAVQAQKTDTAKAVVHYKFSHIRDTTAKDKPYTENMILFVGQSASAYKSYDRKLQDAMVKKQIADQVAANGGMGGPINIKRTGGGITTTEIYQFPLENKMVRKEKLLITNYKIEEPMPLIKWAISADTMSFGTLHCQKATAHFKGRDYTAWFCPDLPFHAGPWKLSGLPGLIVEAYDAKKEVEFKFDGMEAAVKTDKPAPATATPGMQMGGMVVKLGGMDDDADPNVIAIPDNAVKTSEKQYNDLLAAMKKDPQAFMNSMMAGSGMNGGGGMRVVQGGGSGSPNTTMKVNVSGGAGPVINNPLELPEKK